MVSGLLQSKTLVYGLEIAANLGMGLALNWPLETLEAPMESGLRLLGSNGSIYLCKVKPLTA